MSEDSLKKPNEKHLDFIEATIARMAQNSFHAKAWCITVVVAMFAFHLTQDGDVRIAPIVAVALFFSVLDAYYLHLERGYRALYKKVSEDPGFVKDYSMDRPEDAKGFKKFFIAFFSKTVFLFYAALAISYMLILTHK